MGLTGSGGIKEMEVKELLLDERNGKGLRTKELI